MKTYIMINFAIDDINKTVNSALVGIDSDHCDNDCLIRELAIVRLAFNKLEKKYPDNKLTLIDYTYIGQKPMVFIDI